MSDGFRIISRWFLDACVSEAFASFRSGDFALFSDIARLLESLVTLPMDGRGDTVLKLRCMQFLSRINNGERLDLSLQEPLTPLESALVVLECVCREMEVPEREQQRVHSAITEMLVMVCIRSGEFDKAEEVLHTHFSAAADSAGKKKLLLNLIRRRRSCHSVLQLSSYSDFKQDMLQFIERLYRVPEPFLTQMLKRSGHLRVRSEPSTSAREERRSPQKPGAAAEHYGPAVCVSVCGLRAVYGALCEECGVSVPFSRLLQEVQEEAQQSPENGSGDELHLLLSETPMEPLEDEPRYAGMTVSRLVMEDDSQPSADEQQNNTIPADEERSSGRSQSSVSSGDAELQTDRRSSLQQSHDSESAAQRSTLSSPPSHTDTHSGGESTPARCCIPPSVRHTDRKTHSSRRMSVCSDEDSDETPSDKHRAERTEERRRGEQHNTSEAECVLEVCSAAQSSTPARGDHRVCVSSESEVHSTCSQTHTRSAPADSGSSTATGRAKRSRWQDVSGTHEDWSDEESLFRAASGPSRRKKYSRKLWTVQESDWLKEGVQRFGAGRWQKIRAAFPFTGRSACNLKDRWRTMINLKLV